MRDRDGTATRNLIFERAHDTAATAKHIAKTHHRIRQVVSLRRIENSKFGETFCCAHHAGRTYGFIGGDEHESFYPMPDRCFNDILRAEHVVRDCLFDVGFHERNMLVRRSVKDNLRLVLSENFFNAIQIADIGNDRLKVECRKIILEFLQGFKDAVLAVTKQDKFGWVPARELTAEFTANRTTCASDENSLTAQCCANETVVNFGRVAAQEVGDIHFAQAVDADLTADEFVKAGDDA